MHVQFRTIRGDPLRIGQVITNLLSNSVKFTSKGSISMTLCVVKGEAPIVRVEVSKPVPDLQLYPDRYGHSLDMDMDWDGNVDWNAYLRATEVYVDLSGGYFAVFVVNRFLVEPAAEFGSILPNSMCMLGSKN